MIIGKYTKQPGETLDYEVIYDDFFSNRPDSAVSAIATAQAGITIVSQLLTGNDFKVVLSGGTTGTKYKITILMTTTEGIVKEDEFFVVVKEI